jgi:hypothetical protein
MICCLLTSPLRDGNATICSVMGVGAMEDRRVAARAMYPKPSGPASRPGYGVTRDGNFCPVAQTRSGPCLGYRTGRVAAESLERELNRLEIKLVPAEYTLAGQAPLFWTSLGAME